MRENTSVCPQGEGEGGKQAEDSRVLLGEKYCVPEESEALQKQ